MTCRARRIDRHRQPPGWADVTRLQHEVTAASVIFAAVVSAFSTARYVVHTGGTCFHARWSRPDRGGTSALAQRDQVTPYSAPWSANSHPNSGP